MSTTRTRYAIVGLGSRSDMFQSALLKDHAEVGELVAFCDTNPGRMAYANRQSVERFGAAPVATYAPGDFARMLDEQRVDRVIVTSIDRTHHRYVCQAMELGRDAISEKPMTVDEVKCQEILDTVQRTGRKLAVTFNYRYAPRNSAVKEVLMSGAIGRVLSVHFEWLLDTNHGADYFRRWHRDKRNSGGLMVHKSTHHFDLVNWWLGARPQTVFGAGRLAFYGRENAEARGVGTFYDRATGNPAAAGDPFALQLDSHPGLKGRYLDNEIHDGYRRDQSVFSDGISIEDDMAVLVQYDSGATMTYHLTAYSPWEGYRIAFNGTKGRLEYEVEETSYVSGTATDANTAAVRESLGRPGATVHEVREPTRILLRPHWGKPLLIPVQNVGGGHGGGDVRLLTDLFRGAGNDPLGRAADHVDGAWSILTGIAANRSFATGQPVRADQLVKFPG
ncbi:dehydrogenase [Planctomycetota bacterium]|nr:dehydrogenase [Planctomycetota bacterium]